MKLVHSLTSEKTPLSSFNDALLVWIRKPHVINRALCGADIVYSAILAKNNLKTFNLSQNNVDVVSHSMPSEIITLLNALIIRKFEDFKKEQLLEEEDGSYNLYISRHAYKSPKKNGIYELILHNTVSKEAYFSMLCSDNTKDNIDNVEDGFLNSTYKISLSDGERVIKLHTNEQYPDISKSSSYSLSLIWLKNTLLVKIFNWSQLAGLDTRVNSLTLINVADYNRKYNALKEKYAKCLIDIWTENTDPLKFIFEDIGIAAYLLLVWEKYDKKAEDGVDGRQYFVDVGCGNGLLVYILNSEGYRGYGVDIRSRKIWTHLKPNADLRVQTVVPTDSNLFEDAGWLIGNHSDELTPWIPVMAARSKNKCQYFLIPCCPWDFTGKFSQSFKSKSSPSPPGKYEDYLNFIHEVGEICGFNVLKDILRIPSTRRACFVGLAEHEDVTRETSNQERLMKMESYITSRKRASNNGGTDADFKPRDSVEKVKNAAAIDRKLIERIWIATLNELLKTSNYKDYVMCDRGATDGTESKKWNRGGTLSLSKLSEQFSKDELNVLKSECGGLQTVLKNCPDVFAIREGFVKLRDWSSAEFAEYIKWRQNKNSTTNVLKVQRDQTRKTKTCFYYEHHPDGCPLSNAHHCRFAHGFSDLSLNN